MNTVKSFDTVTNTNKQGFQAMFPELTRLIKYHEKSKILELLAAGDNKELKQEIELRYGKIFENLATNVLFEDTQQVDTSTVSTHCNISFTENIKKLITDNLDLMISKKVVLPKRYTGLCLVCGNRINKGVIYAIMNGSSEAVCLSCCDENTYMLEDSEICLAE